MIDDRRHFKFLLASCTEPFLPNGLDPGVYGGFPGDGPGWFSQRTVGSAVGV